MLIPGVKWTFVVKEPLVNKWCGDFGEKTDMSMSACWDLWLVIHLSQTEGWGRKENHKGWLWSSSSQQFIHNPLSGEEETLFGRDMEADWQTAGEFLPPFPIRDLLSESARAAKAVPVLRQIAWLKSKVKALIAWAHVKSGLSSGNPHRIDGSDRERGGMCVCV